MYGAFDVVLYFVIIQLFWLLINLLLILSYVSLPGWRLSRAHSVERPPCTPWQCGTTLEYFFWADVIFIYVVIG